MVNIEYGSWMYATHRLMLIHPCAKYGMQVSNHKKVMGRTQICTDRRTDRVIPIYPPELCSRGYNKACVCVFVAKYHPRWKIVVWNWKIEALAKEQVWYFQQHFDTDFHLCKIVIVSRLFLHFEILYCISVFHENSPCKGNNLENDVKQQSIIKTNVNVHCALTEIAKTEVPCRGYNFLLGITISTEPVPKWTPTVTWDIR